MYLHFISDGRSLYRNIPWEKITRSITECSQRFWFSVFCSQTSPSRTGRMPCQTTLGRSCCLQPVTSWWNTWDWQVTLRRTSAPLPPPPPLSKAGMTVSKEISAKEIVLSSLHRQWYALIATTSLLLKLVLGFTICTNLRCWSTIDKVHCSYHMQANWRLPQKALCQYM